jgi:nitrogen-specific signal transduction histidine kinase
MTKALVVLSLTTAAHVLLSLAVWRSKPSGPANRAFMYLALTLGAWTLSNGLVSAYAGTEWGIVWARVAFLSASLLPLWLFRFVAVFPTTLPSVPRYLRSAMTACAMLACVASLTPLVAQATSSVDRALHMSYGPFYPAFGAYLIASLTGSLVLLGRKLRLSTGVERVQVEFVLLGIGIAAAGGSIANLLVPLVFRTSRLNIYGPIFGLVMVVFIAHAIVRYRLLNIRLVVQRGVTEVVASLTAGAAFLVLAEIASWVLALEPRALPLAVTLLLALVVAQVFQPLRHGVQAALDYYFFRSPYDYAAALREISRAMSDIVELRLLFEYTCRAIADTVHAERAALYVRDAGGSDYRLESSWGVVEPPLAAAVPESSLLLQLLRSGNLRALVTADLRRRDIGGASAELEDLNRLGAECVLPVLMQGEFGAFYVIGPKRSGDPYFTADIDLISAVASQVGIAIRLHVQIGLAEAEKRRAERLVSFGALARELAHEIKNPLVAIRTFAELLPERAGDEEFRESFAKIVLQEIGRIDQLVARLRGFAAPPTRRFRRVDLPQLLRETLALLRGEIERAKVRVSMTGDRSAPGILGDVAQLKQLLLNIIMNALEAVDEEGQIKIRLFHLSPQQCLVLEIEDTGPGVPAELLANIFDAFVTTKPEGSGLGLAIGRAIADGHRAAIKAENNPEGRGFKIILEFPVPDPTQMQTAATDLALLPHLTDASSSTRQSSLDASIYSDT